MRNSYLTLTQFHPVLAGVWGQKMCLYAFFILGRCPIVPNFSVTLFLIQNKGLIIEEVTILLKA